MSERPVAPNPVTIGKRTNTVAWPIMQTVKYVEAANGYMDELEAQLRNGRQHCETFHASQISLEQRWLDVSAQLSTAKGNLALAEEIVAQQAATIGELLRGYQVLEPLTRSCVACAAGSQMIKEIVDGALAKLPKEKTGNTPDQDDTQSRGIPFRRS